MEEERRKKGLVPLKQPQDPFKKISEEKEEDQDGAKRRSEEKRECGEGGGGRAGGRGISDEVI